MNKKQCETKRLFWRIVEIVEDINDVHIKNDNGQVFEGGMLLENGSVTFNMENNTICIYTQDYDEPAYVFTEYSEELLVLKELFASIDGVHELIAEEKSPEPISDIDKNILSKTFGLQTIIKTKPWLNSFTRGLIIANKYCKENGVPYEVMKKVVKAAVDTALNDAIEVSGPKIKKKEAE